MGDGVIGTLRALEGVGHQVGTAHVGGEIDGEADAHDEVDHCDDAQGDVPEVHEAEDVAEDHEDVQGDEGHHEGVRQENEADDDYGAHGYAQGGNGIR